MCISLIQSIIASLLYSLNIHYYGKVLQHSDPMGLIPWMVRGEEPQLEKHWGEEWGENADNCN